MLKLSGLLLLSAALGEGYAISRRDDPSPEVRRALEDAGVDVNLRVAKPKNKVEQVLSIGDSYSAGIGSNGVPDEWGFGNCSRYAGAWPVLLSEKDEWKDYGKDGKKPWLTFGPCSGNVMVDVREKMLEQGDAKNTRWMEETEWPYTPIGKPQIAVMTIAGNDVKFSGIVNDCVIRYKPKMGCDQRLASSKAILASPEFKQELRFTYAKVIAAGRQAGGADPPESFQLYGGGYIGLFNHDDTDCDHVFWNVANGWFAYKQWLTTSLRREFNDLVDELNGIIKSVAEELGPWGAIYVDGYNQGFNNHRFCEHREPKCIHQNSYQDNDMETKIWSRFSPWYEGVHVPALNGGEGRDRANICTKNAESEEEQANIPGDTDILERIADVLVPNPEERQRMRDDPNLAPWNVSAGNWDQYDDVFEMMRDRMKLHSEPIKVKWVYDWTCRSFHPKKSGYQFFASSWMEKIKANRQESPAPAPIPEPACARAAGGPTPGGLSPFHVDAAKDAARKLCGNADYNGIRVVPQIGFGTGQTPEGIKKALGFSEITASADGQTEVTAGVSFSEDTCMGLFTWPPGKPEEAYQSCLNHFDSIIDKCDADTADAKFGGTISDVCVVFKVGAKPKGENPFPIKTPGAIKCKDSNVVTNACTCWYENISGVTDMFAKPPTGCGAINKPPAWTYQEDPDPAHLFCTDPDPKKCQPSFICPDPNDPSTCKPIKR